MHIWDKAGYGHLDFSTHDLPTRENTGQLGWIIENNIMRKALWEKAENDAGIHFFTEERLANISVGDSEVFASFSSQSPILAKVVIGADGANSWVRQQMKIALTFRDYDHHAIVATVDCAQGHQNTAWQVFLETGPLAFLPLSDKTKESALCSIVWSTDPDDAKRLMQLSPEDFSKELTAAADGKLGKVTLQSQRFSYPLTMRYAQNFVKERIILIGDAAHTIHPLAGQGVNLGLLDAAAIAETLADPIKLNEVKLSPVDRFHNEEMTNELDRNSSHQWFSERSLKQFERWRKSDATDMISAMEAIKQIFSPQQAPFKLLRGAGLHMINKLKPIKLTMVKQALGFKAHLPTLSKVKK